MTKTIEVISAGLYANQYSAAKVIFKTDPGEINPLFIYTYSEDGYQIECIKPWTLKYLSFCDWESIFVEFTEKELASMQEFFSKRETSFIWRIKNKDLIAKVERLGEYAATLNEQLKVTDARRGMTFTKANDPILTEEELKKIEEFTERYLT